MNRARKIILFLKKYNWICGKLVNVVLSGFFTIIFNSWMVNKGREIGFSRLAVIMIGFYLLMEILHEMLSTQKLAKDEDVIKLMKRQCHDIFLLFNNKWFFICVIIIVILTYCYYLTSFSISLDEELQFYQTKNTNQWCYEGRYVIAVIKELFMKNGMYAPVFAAAISVITYTVSGIVDIAIFNKMLYSDNSERIISADICFLMSYLAFPAVVFEFMTFNTYSFDVSCGILFASLSVYCLICFFESYNKYCLFQAMLLLFLAIGVYQAIVNVFISLVIICTFLFCLKKGIKVWKKEMLLKIGTSIAVLLIAIVVFYIFFLIATTMHRAENSLSYVNSYANWDGNNSMLLSIRESIQGLYNTITFEGTLSNKYFGFMFAVSIINSVLLLVFERGMQKLNLIFLNIVLTFSCFIFWVTLEATYLPYRTMLAAPLVSGACFYIFMILIYKYFERFSIVKALAFIVTVMFLIRETQTLNIMFYYDDVRAKKDVAFAENVYYEVSKVASGDKIDESVVFLGTRDLTNGQYIYNSPSDGTYFGGNAFGYSIWKRAQEPSRMEGLFGVLGYDLHFERISDEELINKLNEDMTVFPKEGSVIEKDGRIYVKLEELNDGWRKTDDGMKYYINGMPVSGLVLIDGEEYYFDPISMVMVTENVCVDGVTYKIGTDGKIIR